MLVWSSRSSGPSLWMGLKKACCNQRFPLVWCWLERNINTMKGFLMLHHRTNREVSPRLGSCVVNQFITCQWALSKRFNSRMLPQPMDSAPFQIDQHSRGARSGCELCCGWLLTEQVHATVNDWRDLKRRNQFLYKNASKFSWNRKKQKRPTNLWGYAANHLEHGGLIHSVVPLWWNQKVHIPGQTLLPGMSRPCGSPKEGQAQPPENLRETHHLESEDMICVDL